MIFPLADRYASIFVKIFDITSMENDDALVLRTVDFSETSLILTLFTKKFGKIEALAKGGRRLKGPFESALDILAQIRVTFLQKKGDALDLLTESKLVKRFHVTETNLAGLFGGYYLVELINLLTERDDPSPTIYELAVETLAQLETGVQIMRSLVRFEMGLLEATGQQPALDFCVQCGRTMPTASSPNHRVAFGHLEGGILCSGCATELKTQSTTPLTPVSVEALRILAQLGDMRDKSRHWKEIPVNKNVSGEIRGLMNRYVAHRIGRKPRVHDWLTFISRNDRENDRH